MMNKKILFLLAITCIPMLGNATYAQTETQSATLQQKEKTTIFYGTDAFIQAFNAVADSADVITLSSGAFKSTTINKAVTIYGAGCELDETKGVYPTLMNDFYILHGTEKNEEGQVVNKKGDLDGTHIEGICVNNLFIGSDYSANPVYISNLVIKRCRINDRLAFDGSSGGRSEAKNTKIINCIINQFNTDTSSINFSIHNCIINYLIGYGEGVMNNILLIKNCLLFRWTSLQATFKDNILYGTSAISNPASCASYFANNIVRTSIDNMFGNVEKNYNNWIVKTDEAIFGEAVGTQYAEDKKYEIKKEATKTYIGTDGTAVGIYGGVAPFTKIPTNPRVVSKTIEAQSTPEGKLKISIKVEAQPEKVAEKLN